MANCARVYLKRLTFDLQMNVFIYQSFTLSITVARMNTMATFLLGH